MAGIGYSSAFVKYNINLLGFSVGKNITDKLSVEAGYQKYPASIISSEFFNGKPVVRAFFNYTGGRAGANYSLNLLKNKLFLTSNLSVSVMSYRNPVTPVQYCYGSTDNNCDTILAFYTQGHAINPFIQGSLFTKYKFKKFSLFLGVTETYKFFPHTFITEKTTPSGTTIDENQEKSWFYYLSFGAEVPITLMKKSKENQHFSQKSIFHDCLKLNYGQSFFNKLTVSAGFGRANAYYTKFVGTGFFSDYYYADKFFIHAEYNIKTLTLETGYENISLLPFYKTNLINYSEFPFIIKKNFITPNNRAQASIYGGFSLSTTGRGGFVMTEQMFDNNTIIEERGYQIQNPFSVSLRAGAEISYAILPHLIVFGRYNLNLGLMPLFSYVSFNPTAAETTTNNTYYGSNDGFEVGIKVPFYKKFNKE